MNHSMKSCVNSTHVVTHGHAGKPKPDQCGIPMPNTKMRVPTKFSSIAEEEQTTAGRIIFCAEKKLLSCEKPIRTGKQIARTTA
mmetsp:Transcript_74257/g.122687  ORF Transcript_74257/g.122687 Transcript_74257/m.122687 type:complete len:84 (-) Transcript_74257:22-273(-)